jgi:hypothetical protein
VNIRAEKEIAGGRLWRAKEILQGSIPNCGYDCDLFENLGSVLLMMGDLPEAGRFLFLSSRAKPEYDEAIGIFLSRYGKNWRVLFHSFPQAARLSTLSEYPDFLRKQLSELGFPEVLKRDLVSSPALSGSVKDSFIVWLIVGSILLVIVLGVIKAIEILRWLL